MRYQVSLFLDYAYSNLFQSMKPKFNNESIYIGGSIQTHSSYHLYPKKGVARNV